MNKCIISDIFLSFGAVDISYEYGDWVLLEYDANFFLGEINSSCNKQLIPGILLLVEC